MRSQRGINKMRFSKCSKHADITVCFLLLQTKTHKLDIVYDTIYNLNCQEVEDVTI